MERAKPERKEGRRLRELRQGHIGEVSTRMEGMQDYLNALGSDSFGEEEDGDDNVV